MDKGKIRAEDFREAFAKRQREGGKVFKWVQSDYFVDAQKRRYGVTWSCEHSGTWFLNLLEGEFDLAVLLCEVRPGVATILLLPNGFVNRYWHSFSRDKNGEMKFNVIKKSGRFHLQIPQPVGLVDVSDFVSPELLEAPERPEVFF